MALGGVKRASVGWAMVLTTELPHAFAALQTGHTTEFRALTVAKETIWLSREHWAQVDAELAPRLASLGNRGVENAARKLAYRLDRTLPSNPAPPAMLADTGALMPTPPNTP